MKKNKRIIKNNNNSKWLREYRHRRAGVSSWGSERRPSLCRHLPTSAGIRPRPARSRDLWRRQCRCAVCWPPSVSSIFRPFCGWGTPTGRRSTPNGSAPLLPIRHTGACQSDSDPLPAQPKSIQFNSIQFNSIQFNPLTFK